MQKLVKSNKFCLVFKIWRNVRKILKNVEGRTPVGEILKEFSVNYEQSLLKLLSKIRQHLRQDFGKIMEECEEDFVKILKKTVKILKNVEKIGWNFK